MSSNELMKLMLLKPKTAGGRNESNLFKKKKGSKWGKLQSGVRGEINPSPLPPVVGRDGGSEGRRESDGNDKADALGGLPGVKGGINGTDSGLARASSGVRSTLKNVKNMMSVSSILRPSSQERGAGKGSGEGVERMSSGRSGFLDKVRSLSPKGRGGSAEGGSRKERTIR